MELTKEVIQEKIGKLQIESATLQTMHDNMVKKFQEQQALFQQTVQANQNRFQQITGAISNLTELLKALEEPKNESPPTEPT